MIIRHYDQSLVTSFSTRVLGEAVTRLDKQNAVYESSLDEIGVKRGTRTRASKSVTTEACLQTNLEGSTALTFQVFSLSSRARIHGCLKF